MHSLHKQYKPLIKVGQSQVQMLHLLITIEFL